MVVLVIAAAVVLIVAINAVVLSLTRPLDRSGSPKARQLVPRVRQPKS